MLNELEEFLRRAAQRALEAQQKQQQPPPLPPQRTAQPARPIPQRPSLQAEVVDAELLEQPNRVSQSVQQSMRGSEQMSRHAQQLGDRVAQSDEALDSHLHQAFDHKLGRLTSGGGSTLPMAGPANTDTLAASTMQAMHPIAQLFANPLSIRNAIMLREIFERPVAHWDEDDA